MGKLNQLLKQNRISKDQFAHATERARKEMIRAGQAGSRAFGSPAISQLRSYVTTMFGVTQAIGAAKAAFQELESERADMAAKMDESREARGRLFQLPQEPRQLQAISDFVQSKGVDQAKSGQLAFQLASANMTTAGDMSLFARIESSKFADAESLITATDKFKKNFPETGTRDVLSGSLAAASGIAGVGQSEVLNAAITAAKASKAVNIGATDLFAATTVLTQQEKSPERAATQLRSFAAGVRETQAGGKLDVVGSNLNETLDKIKALLDSGAAAKDIIGGRIEARTALDTLLQSRGALSAASGDIQAGINQGIITQRLGAAERDPTIKREVDVAKAEQKRLMARREEALRKIERDEARAAADDPTENLFNRLGRRTAAGAVAGVGADETITGIAGDLGGAATTRLAPILQQATGLSPATLDALNNIRDNTRKAPIVPGPER